MKKIILSIIVLASSLTVSFAQEKEFYTGCLPETNTARLPKQATLMTRDFSSLPSKLLAETVLPYPSITRSIRNLHKLGNNLCVSYNFRCSEKQLES